MMFMGKAKIDNRGRITLPKSFIEANQIHLEEDVYFETIINQSDTIKIKFFKIGPKTAEYIESEKIRKNLIKCTD